MFKYSFVGAFVSLMMNFPCELISFYRFTRLFRMVIRLLITSSKRDRMVLRVSILMFIRCNFTMFIRFGHRTINDLSYNCFSIIKLRVTSFRVTGVQVPRAHGTTRRRGVARAFRMLLVLKCLMIFRLIRFVPDRRSCFFQNNFRFQFRHVMYGILVVSFLRTPTRRPFRRSRLLTSNTISRVLNVARRISMFIRSGLIRVIRHYVLLRLFRIIPRYYGFFVNKYHPIVLIATLFCGLVRRLPGTSESFFQLFFTNIFRSRIRDFLRLLNY